VTVWSYYVVILVTFNDSFSLCGSSAAACLSVQIESMISCKWLTANNAGHSEWNKWVGSSVCFWATICKTVRPMLSDCCLSVLSACNVVGLWPNGLMDQDVTWHAGRPRPWPHCVRWRPICPPQRGTAPPVFGPYPLRPNACIDQDATWYGDGPRPRRFCVRWGPCSSSPKRGYAPKFLAHVYCGQTVGWIEMVLRMEIGLSPGDCVKWGPSPPPKFLACDFIRTLHKRKALLICSSSC